MIGPALEGPKHEWGKWPKIKPESVAPLKNGAPDMYNHVPTRYVRKEEAIARGWHHFWLGEMCVTGHRAARYVSNGSMCVDCVRIQKGQLPVYGKGDPELEKLRKTRSYTQKNTGHLTRDPQPTLAEKRFLEQYAELKDFAEAAEAVGRTESEFLAILSWNTLFREAVNRLEESIGITRTQQITDEFDWNDEKRRAFLITYANTADVKQALRAVGATNVQFHKELSVNADFQRGFDDASQIARNVFDHAASAAAIKGDARLLGRIAANLHPEKFGENMKVDLNVKQTLNPDQINAEITQLLSGFNRQGLLSAPRRASGAVVDAEYGEIESEGVYEAAKSAEGEGADAEPDANSDLVSGSE